MGAKHDFSTEQRKTFRYKGKTESAYGWGGVGGEGARVMEQTQLSFNLAPYSLCLSLQASPVAWKPALEVIMTTIGLKIPKCNNHRGGWGETTQITDAKTHSSEHTSPNQLKLKTEVPRKPPQRVNSASPLGFPRHTLTLWNYLSQGWVAWLERNNALCVLEGRCVPGYPRERRLGCFPLKNEWMAKRWDFSQVSTIN